MHAFEASLPQPSTQTLEARRVLERAQDDACALNHHHERRRRRLPPRKEHLEPRDVRLEHRERQRER